MAQANEESDTLRIPQRSPELSGYGLFTQEGVQGARLLRCLQDDTLFQCSPKLRQKERISLSNPAETGQQEWLNQLRCEEEPTDYQPKRLREPICRSDEDNLFEQTLKRKKRERQRLPLLSIGHECRKGIDASDRLKKQFSGYRLSNAAHSLDNKMNKTASLHKNLCLMSKLHPLKAAEQGPKNSKLLQFDKVWPNLSYKSMTTSIHSLQMQKISGIVPFRHTFEKKNFQCTLRILKKGNKKKKEHSERKLMVNSEQGDFVPTFLMRGLYL